MKYDNVYPRLYEIRILNGFLAHHASIYIKDKSHLHFFAHTPPLGTVICCFLEYRAMHFFHRGKYLGQIFKGCLIDKASGSSPLLRQQVATFAQNRNYLSFVTQHFLNQLWTWVYLGYIFEMVMTRSQKLYLICSVSSVCRFDERLY